MRTLNIKNLYFLIYIENICFTGQNSGFYMSVLCFCVFNFLLLSTAAHWASICSGKWSLILPLARFQRVFIVYVLKRNSCPKDTLPFNWIPLPDTLALYYTFWEGGSLAVVTVPSVLRASWSHEFFQSTEQCLFISGLWEKKGNLPPLSCFIVLLKSISGE